MLIKVLTYRVSLGLPCFHWHVRFTFGLSFDSLDCESDADFVSNKDVLGLHLDNEIMVTVLSIIGENVMELCFSLVSVDFGYPLKRQVQRYFND